MPEGRAVTRAQSQHPSSLGGGVASDHAGGTEATSLPIPLLVPAAAVTPAHCATLGLAAAMRHVGHEDVAEFLKTIAADVLACDAQHKSPEVVRRLVARGGWAQTPHLGGFDPLAADVDPRPTIVQLCDTAGDNKHVVALADGLVFDSNEPVPCKLSRQALDACCLGAARYSHVSYAVRFEPSKKAARAVKKRKAEAEAAAAAAAAGVENDHGNSPKKFGRA